GGLRAVLLVALDAAQAVLAPDVALARGVEGDLRAPATNRAEDGPLVERFLVGVLHAQALERALLAQHGLRIARREVDRVRGAAGGADDAPRDTGAELAAHLPHALLRVAARRARAVPVSRHGPPYTPGHIQRLKCCVYTSVQIESGHMQGLTDRQKQILDF